MPVPDNNRLVSTSSEVDSEDGLAPAIELNDAIEFDGRVAETD